MKKLLTTVLILFFSVLNAQAADNVLQTVQIDGLKDTYNIILKSDTEPQVKKMIKASNRMILELKGVRASNTINTIYNNTTHVDSVMVEPSGDDSLKIFIQADNVENAVVTLDTLNSPLTLKDKVKNGKKSALTALSELKTKEVETEEALSNKVDAVQEEKPSIVLNRPIRDYEQIYDEEDMEEDSGLSGSFIETLKGVLQDENVVNIITIGLIAIIFLCGIKLLKKKDENVQIGLSQNIREREMNNGLYQDLNQRGGVAGPMMNPIMQEYQQQNVNPMQFNPMQNIQAMPKVNPTSKTMPSSMGYGLKAYQTGSKNPYVTNEIKQRQPISSLQENKGRETTVSKAAVNIATKRNVQNMTTAATKPALTASNVDSMRFLESMAKIYEKNGRMDLAKSLKTSMSKAQTR